MGKWFSTGVEGLEGSGLGQDFNVCRPGQVTLVRPVFDIERGDFRFS